MKKFLKISLLSLITIIILAFAVLHISYTTFTPGDEGVGIIPSNLEYIQESYDDCRKAFLAEAREKAGRYEGSELFSIEVPSQLDPELYIDLLYIPPTGNADRLFVLTSGVHGAEGFAGSAIQQMFLKELLAPEILEQTGILLIHGINPYGFKYLRRVTENNVDLNRGSEVDAALFETENPGYEALLDMLIPRGEVSSFSLRNRFFYLVTMSKMIRTSMSTLRQAIVQGQYEYPEGLFFGGNDFEPQIDSLKTILPGYFRPYETILAIDLHTGYGARGILNLFPMPVKDPDIKKKTEFIFEGNEIHWGDSDDFYTVSGAFADAFLPKLNPEALYLYMIFEWGTFDSQKTFGSIKSLQRMINENQGEHFGYTNEKHARRIKEASMELYYPKSEVWRSQLVESGREMISLALKNYPLVSGPPDSSK